MVFWRSSKHLPIGPRPVRDRQVGFRPQEYSLAKSSKSTRKPSRKTTGLYSPGSEPRTNLGIWLDVHLPSSAIIHLNILNMMMMYNGFWSMAHRYLSIGIYWIDLGCSRQVPGLQAQIGAKLCWRYPCWSAALLSLWAAEHSCIIGPSAKIAYLLKITFSTVPGKFLKLDQVDCGWSRWQVQLMDEDLHKLRPTPDPFQTTPQSQASVAWINPAHGQDSLWQSFDLEKMTPAGLSHRTAGHPKQSSGMPSCSAS